MEAFIMKSLRYTNPSSVDDIIDLIGFGRFNVKIFFCMGVLMYIDGMEINMTAVIADTLGCHWNLTAIYTTFISITAFSGMAIGGVYWGWLADSYGRRIFSISCAITVLYFGLLSSVSSNIRWFVILRAFVGFGTGGIVLAPCYLAEMTPRKQRGKLIMTSQFFFAMGSVFTGFMAVATMNRFGWRVFVAGSYIPILIVIFLLQWLPESVRYLRNTDNFDRMIKILHLISRENQEKMPVVDNIHRRVTVRRGAMSVLFERRYVHKLGIMFFLYLVAYGSYFTVITLHISKLRSEGYVEKIPNTTNVDTCDHLTNLAYLQYFIGCLGDIGGGLIMASWVDLIGRQKSATIVCLASFGCFVGLIFEYLLPMSVFTIIILVARGSLTAMLQLYTIYCAELFPTTVRGAALGICMMGSRLGMISLPFMLLVYSVLPQSVMILFCGLCILSIGLIIPLPETRGKELINS